MVDILGMSMFGNLSITKDPDGKYLFFVRINGTKVPTPRFELMSDAIMYLSKLVTKCRGHPHLDLTSTFVSPYRDRDHWERTRTDELRQRREQAANDSSAMEEAEEEEEEEEDFDAVETAMNERINEHVRKLFNKTNTVSLQLS